MKPMLIAAALLLVSGTAQAQAWATVANQNGQTLDLDASSVVDSAGVVTFTARTTFSQPTAYTATDGAALDGVTQVVETYAVNCAARTYIDQGVRYADASGQILAANRPAGAAKAIGSATQSLVGGLIGTVCPS